MLDEKDSINLHRVVIESFREQLMMQETSILHIVRPGQLSVSTQIAMEKDYLDGLAKDLTEKMDKVLLTEAITE